MRILYSSAILTSSGNTKLEMRYMLRMYVWAGMKPKCVETMFYPQTFNPAGIYAVKLYNWTEQMYMSVIVDDYLPCEYNNKGKLMPLFCHMPENREFWSCLLEKAVAKINGEYMNLKAGRQIVQNLHSQTVLSMLLGKSNTGIALQSRGRVI